MSQGREPDPDARAGDSLDAEQAERRAQDDARGRARRRGAVPSQRLDRFSRLILWLAATVLAAALVVIIAAYLPGWWAERVVDVVAGNRAAGLLGGFACGLVFTVLPLLVLPPVVRGGRRRSRRLVLLAFAVLLAAPILLSLGVVVGPGPEGDVARAVLDARGPGFQGGVLAGAVVAVALVAVAWVLLSVRRRRQREVGDLRARLERRDSHGTRDGRADS